MPNGRIKFSQLVSVPPEMRDDDGSPDDLAALGRGLAALKLPSKSDVSRQLDTIAEHHIPFVVITGGWSPAFEAIGASTLTRGGGTHVVIYSDHHFPNLVSEGIQRHARHADAQCRCLTPRASLTIVFDRPSVTTVEHERSVLCAMG